MIRTWSRKRLFNTVRQKKSLSLISYQPKINKDNI